MFAPPTDEQRETLLSLLARAPEGLALQTIVQKLSLPGEDRRVRQWLETLIVEDAVLQRGEGRGALYLAVDPVALLKRFAQRQASTGAAAPANPAPPEATPTVAPAATATSVGAASSADLPGATLADAAPAAALPHNSPSVSPVSMAPTTVPQPSVAPVSPASSDALAPRDSEFPLMFEVALPTLIGARMPRGACVVALRQQALKSGKVGRGVGAYVNYAADRLDALTLADVEPFAITADEFAAWKEQYDPPEPVPAAPLPVAAAAEHTAAVAAARRTLAGATLPTSTPEPEMCAPEATAAYPASAPLAHGTATPDKLPAPRTVTQAVTRALSEEMAGWLPRGMSPGWTLVLVSAVGMVVTGLWQFVQRSRWAMIAIGVAVIAAILWAAARRKTQETTAGNAPSNLPTPVIDPTRLLRRVRWALAAVVVVGVVAGAFVAYSRIASRPPATAVAEYLAGSIGSLPVQIGAVDLRYGKKDATGLPLSYSVRFVSNAPLYRRLTTADYLRTQTHVDLAVLESAAALASGPDGPRIRGAMSAAAPAIALQDIVLVTTATPPGKAVLGSGKLVAWRDAGIWHFSGDPVRLDKNAFAGEPKPAGEGVFAVDAPADLARLRALLAEHAAYAQQVQAAASKLSAELARERQQRIDAMGHLLRPGTVFTGVWLDGALAARIALEITRCDLTHVGTSLLGTPLPPPPGVQRTGRGSPDTDAGEVGAPVRRSPDTPYEPRLTDNQPRRVSGISALLRNDGGWADARRFEGEVTLTPQGDAALTLRTSADARIEGAGPLLEAARSWTVLMEVRSDGAAATVSGLDGARGVGVALQRVDPSAVPVLKAEFNQARARVLAAVEPGRVYRGTATPHNQAFSEGVQLRFTGQTQDGAIVQAMLHSAAKPLWARPFRGTVIANSYRAGNTPIRLQSRDNDRVLAADPRSPLGFSNSNRPLPLALRLDGDRLVGEDTNFSYEFSPAPEPVSAPGSDLSSVIRRPPSGSDPQPSSAIRHPSSVVSPPSASTPSASDLSSVVRPLSSGSSLPVPPAAGCYVLDGGRWLRLPANNGHVVQTKVQSVSAFFEKLNRAEDRLAGKPSVASDEVVAELIFNGKETPPVVSGAELTIIYVGHLSVATPEQLARYPELQTYPEMEIAPSKTLPSGVRTAPLSLIAPGLAAFGPRRVSATLDHPRADVTVLRSTQYLLRGRYAVYCGSEAYEVQVR